MDMTKKFACLSACKANDQCAGYFIKNSQCHTLDESNKYDTVTEEGANYFKKVKQADFAKEALLQHPRDINCLQDSNNALGSCAYPYSYQGSNKYACN